MDKYVEYSKLGLPLFDGINYAFWSIQMKLFSHWQRLDVWLVVENGNIVPDTTPITSIMEMTVMECNAMDMYVIQGGLIGLKSIKVMWCTSPKGIWDKIKNVYEGRSRYCILFSLGWWNHEYHGGSRRKGWKSRTCSEDTQISPNGIWL